MQAATLEVLEQADLPPRQARAIAQAIEIEIAAGHGALGTRHDLRDLGNELRLEIAGLRTELKSDIADLKGDLARWVLLAILGQTAMLLGIGYFVLDHVAA